MNVDIKAVTRRVTKHDAPAADYTTAAEMAALAARTCISNNTTDSESGMGAKASTYMR
jgi:hypothetical protein